MNLLKKIFSPTILAISFFLLIYTFYKSEVINNGDYRGYYKVLAESALRAVKLCQPLKVPSTGYESWKELILNFDAREMLKG